MLSMKRWAEGIGVTTVALVAAFAATPRAFALDDAYIALHSARVVIGGHDAVFGTPALTGVTSPAYVALLVVLLRLGVSDVQALQTAAALGLAAYIGGVWTLAAVAGVRSYWSRAATTVVAVGAGLGVINATNGLETGWAMAVLCWLIAATAARNLPAVALLAGVLPCLRPDLLPAAVLLAVSSVWRRDWPTRLALASLAVATAAPFLAWLHGSTGAWIPETMRAKRLFYAEGCLPVFVKSALFLRGLGLSVASLGLLALGVLGLPRDRMGRIGLVAAGISLLAYWITFPTALTYSYCRYFYPIAVPWCCWGVARLVVRGPRALVGPGLAGAVVATLVLLSTSWREQASFYREAAATADWIDAHVLEGDVVLVHDAGVISERGHRRAVDMVGLKTPGSMAAHARWTWPSCGAERGAAIGAIARTSGASFLILDPAWERTFNVTEGLVSQGIQIELVRRPARETGYSIYRLRRGY
jgi:hypothetical protein